MIATTPRDEKRIAAHAADALVAVTGQPKYQMPWSKVLHLSFGWSLLVATWQRGTGDDTWTASVRVDGHLLRDLDGLPSASVQQAEAHSRAFAIPLERINVLLFVGHRVGEHAGRKQWFVIRDRRMTPIKERIYWRTLRHLGRRSRS